MTTPTTSFSSVTDRTIKRPEWRSVNAQEYENRNIRVKIPNRYRGGLRYDCFTNVNPVVPIPPSLSSSTPRTTTHHNSSALSFRRQRSVSTACAPHRPVIPSKDPCPPPSNPIAIDEESIKRTLNVDEIKWFQHRWLDKHGKSSDLKEYREKMVLLRRWFDSLDTDGSGEVGLDELEDPLVSVGLARNREDVRKLIQDVARSGSGEVNFQEFLHLMNPKKSIRSRVRYSLHQLPQSKTTDNSTRTSPVSPTSHTSPRTQSAGSFPSPAKQTSQVTSPRMPLSTNATGTSSGEGSQDLNAADNPIVKLFSDLQSGKLGDLAIPFPVLITAYRRRMLLNAHMAEDPMARTLGTSVLQALENKRREAALLNEATSSQEVHGEQEEEIDSNGEYGRRRTVRMKSD